MFKILQKQMSGTVTDNEHIVDTTDIMPVRCTGKVMATPNRGFFRRRNPTCTCVRI